MRIKKHWGRKGFALFLALLLALSPAAAFAESVDGVSDELQSVEKAVEETKAQEPTKEAVQETKPEVKPEATETKAAETAPAKETKAAAEPARKTAPDPAAKESVSSLNKESVSYAASYTRTIKVAFEKDGKTENQGNYTWRYSSTSAKLSVGTVAANYPLPAGYKISAYKINGTVRASSYTWKANNYDTVTLVLEKTGTSSGGNSSSGLRTGHLIEVPVYKIVLDSSMPLKYQNPVLLGSFKECCNDGTTHSGYNHDMYVKYAHPSKFGASTESWIGWRQGLYFDGPTDPDYYKTNSTWGTFSTFTSMTFQASANVTGSEPYKSSKSIYLIYEKPVVTQEVTLTYKPNGGTGTDVSESKTVNAGQSASFTVKSSDTFTAPADKVFKEWNTQADGTGTAYAPGAGISISGSTTLYAIWQKKTEPITPRTLTFNKVFNGLDEIPADFSITWNVTCGELTAKETLTLKNATAINEDTMTVTWQVPYFYNQGNTNTVTVIESCDVKGYTYTAKPSSGTVYGNNIIILQITSMFSGGTRSVTNNYQKVAPDPGSVSVEKTPLKTEYQEGADITWNIVVTNDGSETMSGLSVRDYGIEGVILTGPEGINPEAFELRAGESVTFTALLEEASAGTYTNTAAVEQGGNKLDEDTAEDVVVHPAPDPTTSLAIKKTASATEVKAGDTVAYTIKVTNTGDNEAQNVAVTDILDGCLTFIKAVLNDGRDMKPVGGIYTIGNLAAGESVELTITAQVKDDVKAGTVIHNTATADNSNRPADGNKPQDSVDVTVTDPKDPTPAGELTVTKTRTSNATAKPGDTVRWNITIANPAEEAREVTVRDTLNNGGSAVVQKPDGTALAAGETITVPAGGSITLTATYVVQEQDAGKTLINTVIVTDPGEPDKDYPATDEGTKIESGDPTDPTTSLAIEKTASATEVKAGDTVVYTIKVTNTGDNEAQNVAVTDILDRNLTFVEAGLNGDRAMNPIGGIYTIGNLAVGESAVLTITAQIKDDVEAGTVIHNTATADNSNHPEDSDKPEDSVDVTVIESKDPTPTEDLTVVKTRTSSETAKPGDTVRWNITIANPAEEAREVTVRDTLNNGGSAVVQKPDGTVMGAEGIVTVPARGSVILTATYVVQEQDAEKTLINTVIVTDPSEPDRAYPATDEGTKIENGDSTDDPTVIPVGPVTPTTPTDPTGSVGRTTAVDSIPTVAPVAVPAVAALTPTPATAPAPAGTTIADEAVPLAAPAQAAGAETERIADGDVPLAGNPLQHKCCILHFLIMLAALLVEALYTKNMKKHQEKIFELRRELADLEQRESGIRVA